MKKLIGYVWRLTLSLLLAISWLSLETTPALAVHQMRVIVRITEVNNLLRGCFDIEPWGCSRPDYFAVVTLISRNGERVLDTRANFVRDRDNITPGWVLHFGLVETEGLRVALQIFDFDGGLAGIFNQGNQQADVQPGPGMTYIRPVTPGITNFDTTANGNAEVDTRVRGTIEATIQPIQFTGMNVNPFFFDPRFGETVRVTGGVSEQVSVRDISLTMSVNGPGGVFTTSVFTLGADNQHFSFTWDGRINGVIAAPGTYTITISGQSVVPVVWPIGMPPPTVVVLNRPQNDLVFLDFDPVDNWYPGLGPLQVRYSTGSDASVTKRIFEGNSCIGALRRIFVPASLTSGVSTLGWDGKDETGVYVQPGDYSVEVTADFRIGNPTPPPRFCMPFTVIYAPPLELAVEHAPIIPIVNDTMVFRASALTATHAGRLTGAIEIWIADQNAVSAGTAPTTPVRICQRSAICEVNLANLTPRTGRIAYRAMAYDIDGVRMETPWRIVDVVDESVVGGNNAIAAGVATQSFSLIRPETTLDIVFFPGSNYDLSQADGGRREFLDDVAASIREFWGIGRVRRPSTLLANQMQLSFWIILRDVWVRPLNPNALDSPCIFVESEPTWANAKAIIHRVDCRDWSNPFNQAYSARAPGISWHELHHAAFGLADEYCCDGGYFQLPVHPNLFIWPGDCNLDLNAPPGGCRPVRPAGNILPGQQTRWWRIDLENTDVLVDNSFQRGAEIRRSNWVFDQCRIGRC